MKLLTESVVKRFLESSSKVAHHSQVIAQSSSNNSLQTHSHVEISRKILQAHALISHSGNGKKK